MRPIRRDLSERDSKLLAQARRARQFAAMLAGDPAHERLMTYAAELECQAGDTEARPRKSETLSANQY
jgi:hypothetical protein